MRDDETRQPKNWQVTWTETKDGRPYRRWRTCETFSGAQHYRLRRLADRQPVDAIEHRVKGAWRSVDVETGQFLTEPADIETVSHVPANSYVRAREQVLLRDRHVCQDCGGIASAVSRIPGRLAGADWLDPETLAAICGPCQVEKQVEQAENARSNYQRFLQLDESGVEPERDRRSKYGPNVDRRAA